MQAEIPTRDAICWFTLLKKTLDLRLECGRFKATVSVLEWVGA